MLCAGARGLLAPDTQALAVHKPMHSPEKQLVQSRAREAGTAGCAEHPGERPAAALSA